MIDHALKGDIAAWMNLVRMVAPDFPGLETEAALKEHRQTVLEFMERQEAACARQNDKIVGVLLFSRERNELCFLAVAPAFRRQHIGEALVQFALPLMDADREVTVTTYREGAPEGIAARSFYQKLGFQPGRLTKEFGSGVQEFTWKYP